MSREAQIERWVARVNRAAIELDAKAASMHPAAWAEQLAPDFAAFEKLARQSVAGLNAGEGA